MGHIVRLFSSSKVKLTNSVHVTLTPEVLGSVEMARIVK